MDGSVTLLAMTLCFELCDAQRSARPVCASAAALWGPKAPSVRRGRKDCTQRSRAAGCRLPQRTKAAECYHSF